jgi:hypothetical protein
MSLESFKDKRKKQLLVQGVPSKEGKLAKVSFTKMHPEHRQISHVLIHLRTLTIEVEGRPKVIRGREGEVDSEKS